MTLPTYFISHGGGPWPWLKDQMHGAYDSLEASLKNIPHELSATPKAVLAISGHWEAPQFMVQSNPHPPMVYDYGGFPAFTYQIKYPAPGSPELAQRVVDLLASAGFKTGLDAQRGYDHGVFAPFAVIYPEANVPIVQLSLRADYDPATHLAAGRALAGLREEGILIVGSGLSYHNLREFGATGAIASRQFDTWLSHTLCEIPPDERTRALLDWDKAPSARRAHPREDHLIPLMIAIGAAEREPATRMYHEDKFFGGLTASSFRLG
jgi:aromatic ring-opening dioxygenase catalytic subunit (LigB family)